MDALNLWQHGHVVVSRHVRGEDHPALRCPLSIFRPPREQLFVRMLSAPESWQSRRTLLGNEPQSPFHHPLPVYTRKDSYCLAGDCHTGLTRPHQLDECEHQRFFAPARYHHCHAGHLSCGGSVSKSVKLAFQSQHMTVAESAIISHNRPKKQPKSLCCPQSSPSLLRCSASSQS
jgi:hypothetical protein